MISGGPKITYVPLRVDLGAGLEQPPDDVVVAHLRGDPEGSRPVRPGRLGPRPVGQQHLQDAHVAVLRRYEEGRRAVLLDVSEKNVKFRDKKKLLLLQFDSIQSIFVLNSYNSGIPNVADKAIVVKAVIT